MKQPWRFLACVIVFVIVGWYIGAMFDFFPFYADDFAVRAVGFATLILSVVARLHHFNCKEKGQGLNP